MGVPGGPLVGVLVRVGVWVRHPGCGLPMVTSSLRLTSPSPLQSHIVPSPTGSGHALCGTLPREISIHVFTSFSPTTPTCVQSPQHGMGVGVAVIIRVPVGVIVLQCLGVVVGATCAIIMPSVAVGVAVAPVAVAVTVGVCVVVGGVSKSVAVGVGVTVPVCVGVPLGPAVELGAMCAIIMPNVGVLLGVSDVDVGVGVNVIVGVMVGVNVLQSPVPPSQTALGTGVSTPQLTPGWGGPHALGPVRWQQYPAGYGVTVRVWVTVGVTVGVEVACVGVKVLQSPVPPLQTASGTGVSDPQLMPACGGPQELGTERWQQYPAG